MHCTLCPTAVAFAAYLCTSTQGLWDRFYFDFFVYITSNQEMMHVSLFFMGKLYK